MPSLRHLPLLLAGLWSSTAAADGPTYRDAFIVESDPSTTVQSRADLLNDVASALSELGASCKATPRNQFNSPHFTGSSFNLECDSSVERQAALQAIKNLAAVGKAWPVRQHKAQRNIPSLDGSANLGLPGVVDSHVGRQQHVPSSHTPNVVVARDSAPADTLSTHAETGIDRLHAEGITGKNIRIAVVDSSFDTSVPGLSGTTVGYAKDIISGGPVVGDNCSYHGTHVLGIVGAKGTADARSVGHGVNGAAYDATPAGADAAQTDDLIAAFLQAGERGVDVITCSYGGDNAFPEEPWVVVATRLARNGTFVSLSNGNSPSGTGPFTGSGAGMALDVMAVGATYNTITPCIQWQGTVTYGGKTSSLSFTPGSRLDGLVPEKERNGRGQLQPSRRRHGTPADPSNTILLVERSRCWVDQDGVSLTASPRYNFTYVMRYMFATPDTSPKPCPWFTDADAETTRGIISISRAAGLSMMTALSQGDGKNATVTVTLPSDAAAGRVSLSSIHNTEAGGQLTYYSSWGPSLDGRSRPALLTPGHNILSTFPSYLGGWGVIGGTSMSTPLVAGIAALVRQTHPAWDGARIQAAMALTARPIGFNTRQRSDYSGENRDFLAPVIAQGAGFVDAWAAVHTVTLTNTTALNFNDTAHRPSHLAFTLTNTGSSETLSYKLGHRGAASGYVMNTTYTLATGDAQPIYAELEIVPSSLTLGPGQFATVSVSVASEPALPEAAKRISYFGGYVTIDASSSADSNASTTTLSLPYTAFGGALASLPMINRDRGQTYLAAYDATTNQTSGDPLPAGRVFECLYNNSNNNATANPPCTFPADGLAPGLALSLVTQTRNLTIDLVDKGTHETVLPGGVYASGSNNPWDGSGYQAWDGRDRNRAFVPAGEYVWRVTALRLNADSGVFERDWDVWESESWVLRYAAGSTGLPPGGKA
ncbi:subtilisin-like serine protease PR1C [Apiospora aurea]|uniref:Subtilisin-like serine protease PR1C n=1 Tax=Apiospora aurea TaxID=335848 RepID=A0ABR1QG35_9PEZI